MRALIYEPSGGGHRFQHVRLVAEALLAAGAEVVVATSAGWRRSDEFQTHLACLGDRVRMDDGVRVDRAGPVRTAITKAVELGRAASRCRPDHIYMPYADGTAQVAGSLRRIGLIAGMRGVEAEGLMMRCAPAYWPPSWRRRLARALWLGSLSGGAWSALHLLDPIAYEFATRGRPSGAVELDVIPEPVEPMGSMSRSESRERLGIPVEGRYIGCSGGLDTRKGVDRLIHAFAAADLRPDDRLLLVGKARPPIDALLGGEYRRLVESGRIVLIDRYVSEQELVASFFAMDVVCTPYPRHIGSSGIVVRAAAAGRPVLSAPFGWVGQTTRRFGLGDVCSVDEPAVFAAAVRASLEKSGAFTLGEAGRRFVRYHTASNYAMCWVRRWRERAGLPADTDRIPWSWVSEAAET